MSLLLLGLTGAFAAGLGVVFLDLIIRRADVGALLVFLAAIVQAVFVSEAVPSVSFHGIRVGVTDVAAVLVLGAAVARCLRMRQFSRHHYWLIMMGVLLLVSLVRGLGAHGVQASIADSRQYLFFVGAALYMATFRPTADLYDRIGRIWLMTAVLMVLLACLRWLKVFGGIDLGVPAEVNGVDTPVRVLDGPYAFFLAGPLLLVVASRLRRDQPRWVRWLGTVLLVVVIALDRRTVWVAILVGTAVLLLRGRRHRGRVVALLVSASVLTAVVFAGDVLARDDSAPGTVTSTGSVTWRLEGWSELLASWSASPVNWFLGEPFGGGFARTINESMVNAHPHNFYIETMIRAGLGGLVTLSALSFGLLLRLWKAPVRGVGMIDPSVLPPLLAMQLVWYLTWVPGLEQGIVTGMAIAVAATGAQRGRGPTAAGDHGAAALRSIGPGTHPPTQHATGPPAASPPTGRMPAVQKVIS